MGVAFRRVRRVGWVAGVAFVAALGGVSVVDAVPPELEPGQRVCFDVEGGEGEYAIVNLTPVQAWGPGNGQLVSSDIDHPPVASNVNFDWGSVDPNLAVAPIGGDGQVCFVNSDNTQVHVVADHFGSIATAAFVPASPSGAPERAVDTRIGLGGARVGPSGRLCFSVDGSAGDLAVVNLTPVGAESPGFGQLVSSDVTSPPVASNVNYGLGTVDPNVAIAPIGSDGQVCYVNGDLTSVDVVADHLGTVLSTAATPASPSGAPVRVVDTRIDLGATGKVDAGGRVCLEVAGEPGDVAVVNLTPVEADYEGFGVLVSSDAVDTPLASTVNFAGPSAVDPNVGLAAIGADGKVCYVNSELSPVHLVADHLASLGADVFRAASADGAPVRVVDTRYECDESEMREHIPGFVGPATCEFEWAAAAIDTDDGSVDVVLHSVSGVWGIVVRADTSCRDAGASFGIPAATLDAVDWRCTETQLVLDEAPDGAARVVATGDGIVGRDLAHEVTDEWLPTVEMLFGAPEWSDWGDAHEYPDCVVTTRRIEWPEITLIERLVVRPSSGSYGASHLAGFVVPDSESPSIENLLTDRAGETIGNFAC